MIKEVAGIPLASLEETIRYGLQGYSDISEGAVSFALDAACQLELTPDKPNSARSVTTVGYLGEAAATLCIIAFAPGDGTGDESYQKLAKMDTGDYLHAAKIVGRHKSATHSETHLTLLSRKTEDANAEPVVFAGSLDLVDGRSQEARKLANLGQDNYKEILAGEAVAIPTSTLTVGYRGALSAKDGSGLWSYWRQRFGEVHAVYNPSQELQVCGFIGIPAKDCVFEDLNVLRALQAKEPTIIND